MANLEKRLKASDRNMRALQLRKMGLTYKAIADQLNYKSPQAAFTAVKRMLDRVTVEEVNDYRKLECERLDAALQAIYVQVINGAYGAIDRFIKISERRARLLGLDAPAAVDLSSGGLPIPATDTKLVIIEHGIDPEVKA